MKTYYQCECKDCGNKFFVDWQPINTKPFCPNCGNEFSSELTGEEVEVHEQQFVSSHE